MIRPCPYCNSRKVEVIGFGYEIWDNVQDSIEGNLDDAVLQESLITDIHRIICCNCNKIIEENIIGGRNESFWNFWKRIKESLCK